MASQSDLMARFKFDAQDLESNRNGTLSHRQREEIQKSDRSISRVVLVLGLACAAGAVWAIVRLIPVLQQGFDPANDVGRVFVVALLLFFTFILLRGATTKLSTDVGKVEGKLKLLRTERRGTGDDSNHITTSYYFVVGGREFGIQLADFDLFEEDERYAVYFSPDTTNLLSLERIEEF